MLSTEDQLLLERNRHQLMHRIDLEGSMLVAHLRSTGCLTPYQQELIESGRGNPNQVGKLLDIILQGDSNVMNNFIYALQHSGHSHVARAFLLDPRRSDDPFRSEEVTRDTSSPATTVSTENLWVEERKLGAGAYGQVFLWVNTRTRERIAEKRVNIDSHNDTVSKELEAIKCELELLKTMCHERIVQYDSFQESSHTFSVFIEYMSKGSVKDQFVDGKPLGEATTRNYTRQVLQGLAYLHENGVIHRDIKGANILIGSSGDVKLADFGVSARMKHVLTFSGAKTTIGTPYWMAPEVVRADCEHGYGRKVDIWSLGCTVVEMLTTNPPWHKLEPFQASFKIGNYVHPIYELPCNVSMDARTFLDMCFKKQEKRPSAKQLLQHSFMGRSTFVYSRYEYE